MLFLAPFGAELAIYDRLLSTALKLVFCCNMLFYLPFPVSAWDINLPCETLSNTFWKQFFFFLSIEAVVPAKSSGKLEKYSLPHMSLSWQSQRNLVRILYLHAEKSQRSLRQIKCATALFLFPTCLGTEEWSPIFPCLFWRASHVGNMLSQKARIWGSAGMCHAVVYSLSGVAQQGSLGLLKLQ